MDLQDYNYRFAYLKNGDLPPQSWFVRNNLDKSSWKCQNNQFEISTVILSTGMIEFLGKVVKKKNEVGDDEKLILKVAKTSDLSQILEDSHEMHCGRDQMLA
jgi:hypothetical protein